MAKNQVLAAGLLTALLGLLASGVPWVRGLEAELGLGWLFKLRGVRPAPAAVLVVTLDRESSERLELPNQPQQWPRRLHGQLIRKLTREGARVIAFDIRFMQPQGPTQDAPFAAAVREAGNVVLFEHLQRPYLKGKLPGVEERVLNQVRVEKRVPPLPELAQAAAGLGLFPLPKVPVRVDQFWLFKPGAGDAPTLPVVALHVYALSCYDGLLPLLRELAPEQARLLPDGEKGLRENGGVTDLAQALHRLLQSEPGLAPKLLARWQAGALDGAVPACAMRPRRAAVQALLALHAGEDSRYLDFYGPPRSITTVPYHRALSEPLELRDKAVFVGFSEHFQPDQTDNFYTVFSQPDGVDLSGVEIAATAFANLLENRSVRSLAPPWPLLVPVVWGLLLGALLVRLPIPAAVLAAVTLPVIYIGLATQAFAGYALWLPLVVPVLVQAPLALVGALLWRYRDTRQQALRMQQAFGYYLPGRIVTELARDSRSREKPGQSIQGVCLATDAQQYTALSERLRPERLGELLNNYYAALFKPVGRRGGFISDVVGDAMLAVWEAAGGERAARRQACAAALEMIAAVDAFNGKLPEDRRLPTRIGLHCGPMLLGNVGAGDHFEFRAVGDTVNTASRLQGLNKYLGTRVVVSAAMLSGLNEFFIREIGSFRLQGKSRPLVIHELVARAGGLDAAERRRYAYFAAGLQAFRNRRWQEARVLFEGLLDRYPDDGPARYYRELCERYLRQPPPPSWDGVIVLDNK